MDCRYCWCTHHPAGNEIRVLGGTKRRLHRRILLRNEVKPPQAATCCHSLITGAAIASFAAYCVAGFEPECIVIGGCAVLLLPKCLISRFFRDLQGPSGVPTQKAPLGSAICPFPSAALPPSFSDVQPSKRKRNKGGNCNVGGAVQWAVWKRAGDRLTATDGARENGLQYLRWLGFDGRRH